MSGASASCSRIAVRAGTHRGRSAGARRRHAGRARGARRGAQPALLRRRDQARPARLAERLAVDADLTDHAGADTAALDALGEVAEYGRLDLVDVARGEGGCERVFAVGPASGHDLEAGRAGDGPELSGAPPDALGGDVDDRRAADRCEPRRLAGHDSGLVEHDVRGVHARVPRHQRARLGAHGAASCGVGLIALGLFEIRRAVGEEMLVAQRQAEALGLDGAEDAGDGPGAHRLLIPRRLSTVGPALGIQWEATAGRGSACERFGHTVSNG